MKSKLFVDLDGTLAEFRKIASDEELLADGYYANLKPAQAIVDMVNNIVDNNPDIDVYILSAYLTESKTAQNDKYEWARRYLPNIPKERVILVPCGTVKAEHIRAMFLYQEEMFPENFFLLDDYTKNLNEWKFYGGTGIKLLNGINHTNESWKGKAIADPTVFEINYEKEASILSGIISNSKDRLLDVPAVACKDWLNIRQLKYTGKEKHITGIIYNGIQYDADIVYTEDVQNSLWYPDLSIYEFIQFEFRDTNGNYHNYKSSTDTADIVFSNGDVYRMSPKIAEENLGATSQPRTHIAIYQLREDSSYEHFEASKSDSIDKSNYYKVWEGYFPSRNLDSIYEYFNTHNHPETYFGHSISVSDIIEIDKDAFGDTKEYFYCEPIGYSKVKFSVETEPVQNTNHTSEVSDSKDDVLHEDI